MNGFGKNKIFKYDGINGYITAVDIKYVKKELSNHEAERLNAWRGSGVKDFDINYPYKFLLMSQFGSGSGKNFKSQFFLNAKNLEAYATCTIQVNGDANAKNVTAKTQTASISALIRPYLGEFLDPSKCNILSWTGRCGSQGGNKTCSSGSCSAWGWCGFSNLHYQHSPNITFSAKPELACCVTGQCDQTDSSSLNVLRLILIEKCVDQLSSGTTVSSSDNILDKLDSRRLLKKKEQKISTRNLNKPRDSLSQLNLLTRRILKGNMRLNRNKINSRRMLDNIAATNQLQKLIPNFSNILRGGMRNMDGIKDIPTSKLKMALSQIMINQGHNKTMVDSLIGSEGRIGVSPFFKGNTKIVMSNGEIILWIVNVKQDGQNWSIEYADYIVDKNNTSNSF